MERTRGQRQQQTPKQPAITFPNDPEVPDVYAEGVGINVGFNSVSFIFNRNMRDPVLPVPVAVVRISPQQAFLMTQLLRKALKQYQEEIGKIPIPHDVIESLEIEEEL